MIAHLRNPTTAQRGYFELLDVSSGPFRTSLDNLGTLGSPRVSMLMQSLVRTLVQRVTQCSRTPVLKPSSKSGLPFAWITVPATDTSQQNGLKWDYITLFHKCLFGKTIFSSFSHGKFSSTWIFKNVWKAWVPTRDRVLLFWTSVWGWTNLLKATQTVPHPSLLYTEQWAIINDPKNWILESASRSGCETLSHHRGLRDFEFH